MKAALLPESERSRRDSEFGAIALPLLPAIARLARALTRNESDAEDLVQETYLRAYRYWHTFDTGTDCRRWLATICRNLRYDLSRRDAQVRAVDDEELESLAAARLHKAALTAGLGDMYARIDLGPAILKSIGDLDPVFRDVVVLSDIEGQSYAEIAVTLDIPIGTVRSRLYRARRHLQEALLVYAIDAGLATAATNAGTERK